MAYIGNQPSSGAFRKLDTLVFNGSTATFGLIAGGVAVSPGTATNLIISLNGVVQEPGTSYDVSGSNITFSSAPGAGSTFFGVQLGSVGTVNIVTDGSITADKLSVTPIPVIKGGTGTASLTGLVKGNGTGALTEAVSGTDIKTVNDVPVLGSGNITVQVPLVSGTNIKTINGVTLLGSGNYEIISGSDIANYMAGII
jgi:hypothetical protein